MSKLIDAILKLSIVASLLLASSGVGYYYGLYLPARDAERDRQQMSDVLLAYGQKRADQEQAVVEQRIVEQRRASDKAAAATRYEACLDSARVTHDASWAAACKRLADQALAEHADCLSKSNLSQGYCDAAYRPRDASPNCTLPAEIATSLDGDLTNARNRCLRERNAALQ